MAENMLGITESLFGARPASFQSEFAAALPAFKGMSATDIGAAATFAGARELGRGLMSAAGVEDPEMASANRAKAFAAELQQQGVSMQSAQGMKMLAQKLSEAGDFKAAQAAAALASQFELSSANVNLKQAQTVKALREKNPEFIQLQDAREQLVAELGPDHPRVKQLDAYLARKGQGQQINVGVSTIDKEGNLRKDFLGETKPFRDPYIAATKIENLLQSESSLADKITRKQWAKLAGDATISNKDTDAVTNFGDIGQRLIGIINQFADGTYSEEQRNEAINLARQIRSQAQSQYKDVQSQFIGRAKDANIPESTLKFIAPELPTAATSAFVVGRQYRDKNGKLGIFQGYDEKGQPKFKPVQ